VRWDSDHVVIANDDVLAIAQETVRCGSLDRIRFGLDYFDASIHRVAAWVIGARSLLRTLVQAALEPIERLQELESQGNLTARLAMLEELRAMPWQAVWDYYCLRQGVPIGRSWLGTIEEYEKDVTSRR
jgi:L-rhamnose isomerase